MYFPVLLWSLVIFASFWGYGEALRRALKRPEFDDLGWGLTAAWGMAVTLAIGGLLMMLSLAKAPVLTGVVLLGAALTAFYIAEIFTKATNPSKPSKKSKSPKQNAREKSSIKENTVKPRFRPVSIFLYSLPWALAVLAFATAVAWPHHIDPNDDLVCYLMLPLKLLATGTLIEPFSFQRAGTFGGQAILQALAMIPGNELNGHVPERGLSMLVVFGILLGACKRLRMPYSISAVLVLICFWFVPVPRISTNGAMTGGCLLLALLDSLHRVRSSVSSNWNWRLLLPSALLAAGACCIKPTYAVVIAGVFAALFIASFFLAKPWPEKMVAFRNLILIGVICTAVLIPFMVVLYQSNGTPMVPPISGFVSKAFQTYDHPEFSKNLQALFTFVSVPNTLAILAMLLPIVLFAGPKERLWMIGGIFAGCFVIIIRFGALAYLDLYRYLYPILVPVFLWYLAMALKTAASAAPGAGFLRHPLTISSGIAAVLVLFAWPSFPQGVMEFRAQLQSLPSQIAGGNSFLDPRLRASYQTIQNAIPPGAKVLTMVDASYWLDYKRNPMVSINAVGGSSPPPGIPFGKGPQALADYLRGLGFEYVIAVDFNNAVLLYTRRLWTTNTRPEWFYPQIWRPRFLDVMDSIDDWDLEGKVIARSGNLRLFDLGK
jgi:hypothetical protein